MKYDPRTFTFGAELEVSDVDRRIPIPSHLGEFALTETDVINRHAERRGLACDPLGIAPHWGGEVNLRPAASVSEAGERMAELLAHLKSQPGNIPDYDAFNASHVHVRVPGLRDDIDALKRLQQFVIDHQDRIIAHSFRNYVPPPWSKSRQKVHTVPLDGKRKMQPWMNDNIQRLAKTPEEFFALQCKGKDGVKPYRIFRYCVNTYNLRLIDTVEFRWFRPTLLDVHWKEMFAFVHDFMDAALNGSELPPLDMYGCWPVEKEIDLEMWEAWERTRYTQDRFLKDQPRRRLQSVV